MGYEAFSWSCGLIGVAAFLYKLPALRRNRSDPALIALCVYFLCSGVSYLVDSNPIRACLLDLLDYPNITTVLVQAAVVILTAAQQVVLVHWSHPPDEARRRARNHIVGYGIALVVLVAGFFYVSPPHRSHSAENAVLLNVSNPRYAVYFSYYLAICAVGQARTVHLSRRYARLISRSWLRTGMWAVTAGAATTLVYCAIRYTEVVGDRLGADVQPWDWLYWVAGNTGSVLQVFGWTVPSWGPRLSAGVRWLRAYRDYRALHPLWWALYRATPAIALDPPPSRLRDLAPPRDLQYRLYRRVIEIRDGQLALRPYLDPGAVGPQPSPGESASGESASEESASGEPAGSAAGRGPADQASVTREALLLRAALQARYGDRSPAAAAAGSLSFTQVTHDDLEEEVAWLTRVSREFRRHTADRAEQADRAGTVDRAALRPQPADRAEPPESPRVPEQREAGQRPEVTEPPDAADAVEGEPSDGR